VIEWDREEGNEIIKKIVCRAYEDDKAEHWLSIHPASSLTGLTSITWKSSPMEGNATTNNEQRLLTKRFAEYSKRLLK